MMSSEYEKVPANGGMGAMEVEISESSSPSDTNKDKFRMGMAVLVSTVVALLAVSFVYRNQSSSSINRSNNYSSSWPPPAVKIDNMDDFRIHIDGAKIDTHRPRMILCRDDGSNVMTSMLTKSMGKSRSGGSVRILQKLEAETHNSVKQGGQVVETDLDMSMDHNVINIRGDGNSVEITTNHIAMTMTSHTGKVELMDIHYDSENPEDYADPQMKDIHAMIGQTTKIEVDEHGKVIHSSHDHNENDDGAKNNDRNDKLFAPQNQWDQLTCMTKILPFGKEVEPGDSWDFDMEMDAKFHGRATLLGYTTYDHSDCAVIQLKGQINFDSNQRRHLSDNSNYHHGVEFEDGSVSAILYWDHHCHLVRFSKTQINLVVDVRNPLHPNAKSQLPTEEILTVYSSIMHE